jgi:hypothetical protein
MLVPSRDGGLEGTDGSLSIPLTGLWSCSVQQLHRQKGLDVPVLYLHFECVYVYKLSYGVSIKGQGRVQL